MELQEKLSVLNQRIADKILPQLPKGIVTCQNEHETLLFRGVIPNTCDPEYVGTHLLVKINDNVRDKLDEAESTDGEEMTVNLVNSLATQILTTYDPENIGEFGKEFIGSMDIIN